MESLGKHSNFGNLTQPLLSNASLVCVSDVHVKTVGDKSWRLLLKLITDLETHPPEVFLLNGDIFDICIGVHPYFQKKFLPVAKALEKLANVGTRVIFMQGNHEFYLKDLNWSGVEFNPEIVHFQLRSGQAFLATHGDMILPDFLHRLFRWVTSRSLLKGLVRNLPGKLLDQFCLKLSGLSRHKNKNLTFSPEKILTKIQIWYQDLQCKEPHLIIGHYHYPFAHKLQSPFGNTLVLSMATWWQVPSALCFNPEHGFYRIEWDEDGDKVEPVILQ